MHARTILSLTLAACEADKAHTGGLGDSSDSGAWDGQTVLADALAPSGPYPGYAVLGNGLVAAVYTTEDGSDDPPGVSHLYAGDLGTDLLEIGQTLVGQEGARIVGWESGLDPFFAAYAELALPDGGALAWRAFAAADVPALVIAGALVPDEDGSTATVAPLVQLRSDPHIDGTLSIAALGRDEERGVLWAELSDGGALALALSPAPTRWEAGEVVADPVDGGLRDRLGEGRQLALAADLAAEPGSEAPFRQVIAVAGSPSEAVDAAVALLEAEDPLADAAAAWADLAPDALCSGPRCEIASANLAAAAASTLGGGVPADLTGQFVTDGHPQLYPRDAAMVARALAAAGRTEDAWSVVSYWLSPALDRPRDGEWYARYDALGRGVDGGTGADFDTPEWDINAYLPLLVERLGADELPADEREPLLLGLDLLVEEQDEDGLWTEGGIVEWTGRLPATAMIAWAGLDAGARLADGWGEAARAADYRAAAGRVRGGLLSLLDETEAVLTDERDGAWSWDTSLLFGPVLGYPADPLLDHSWRWIYENARVDGGVRYFEDPWGGTGSYGQDLFFFTTAAAAWYALSTGEAEAEVLLAWMSGNTNAYGLAPERVYSDGTGASVASPLSWCAAELALTLIYEETLPDGPTLDGLIGAAEHRRAGGLAVIDHDGAPDTSEDMVALYASVDGEALTAALRLAGPGDEVAGSTYTLWLSGADGSGAWTTTDAGARLLFRAEGAPGATARVDLDPASGTCLATSVDGVAEPCPALAAGRDGLELELDLGALGLAAPVQLIVARASESEALLPRSGSLSTGGPGETVLVTFEVDASALDLGDAVITLSGDRDALGAWAGDALGLRDDGAGQDEVAGDGVWTTTVAVPTGGWIAYKYLTGTPGDGSWAGVEFDGENRALRVDDLDGSGRVWVRETFGVRGGTVLDP